MLEMLKNDRTVMWVRGLFTFSSEEKEMAKDFAEVFFTGLFSLIKFLAGLYILSEIIGAITHHHHK
jgi:hypothetical protein